MHVDGDGPHPLVGVPALEPDDVAAHVRPHVLRGKRPADGQHQRPLRNGSVRVAINPKSQVVRHGPKRWKKVVRTAKRLSYEVEKRWPGETTGGRRIRSGSE